jgi:hypothetical protein
MSINTEIISRIPINFVTELMGPAIFGKVLPFQAERIVAILEIVPYNTPVVRWGNEYRAICDTRGYTVLTRDGVIIAHASLLREKVDE